MRTVSYNSEGFNHTIFYKIKAYQYVQNILFVYSVYEYFLKDDKNRPEYFLRLK